MVDLKCQDFLPKIIRFSYLNNFFNGWEFLTENRFAKDEVGVNFTNIVEKIDFNQKQKTRKKRSQ